MKTFETLIIMEVNSYYHVFNKGNNGETIFFERANYVYFLKQYDRYLTPYVATFAYCLMPNYFHLLLKVLPQANENDQTSKVLETFEVLVVAPKPTLTSVQKAFKDFFISYAKSINKKYQRTGSLFQYKFKRKAVDTDAYFVKLAHYIHYNPIKASLCKHYEDWEFSSYRALISDKPTKLQRDEVLRWFGGREQFIAYHQQVIVNEHALQGVLVD